MGSRPNRKQVEQTQALAKVAFASSEVRRAREAYERARSQTIATRQALSECRAAEKAALRVAVDLGVPGAVISIVSGRVRTDVHIVVYRARRRDFDGRRRAARAARAKAEACSSKADGESITDAEA